MCTCVGCSESLLPALFCTIFAIMESFEKTYALTDIEAIATMVLENLPASKVVTFEGDLGAGKTTLINTICNLLNVKDSVGSPTFSIINEYQGDANGQPLRIFHIDLYRLSDEEEARQAGIEDCLYGDGISFVEWPSKVPSIIPEGAMQVELSHLSDGLRHIVVRTMKND